MDSDDTIVQPPRNKFFIWTTPGAGYTRYSIIISDRHLAWTADTKHWKWDIYPGYYSNYDFGRNWRLLKPNCKLDI